MSSPTNKNFLRKNSSGRPVVNGDGSRGSGLGLLSVLLACAIVAGLVAINRTAIYDWVRLRGYAPPPAVVRLADQDGMKAYTRHLFYLNRPGLLPGVRAFRRDCPENENTIVLGCYHPGQNGIYIYDVQDPKLSGVQQVTAAHEVLHAVYARLSSADRESLNRQLQDFYRSGLKDRRVMDEVRIYQKTEPGDVLDEMSCTFGTEVAKLPPGLEAYYSRYFDDRSKIVAYEQKYEDEFTRRQALIKQYDAQLADLKAAIDAAEADLAAKQHVISARQDRLNSLNSSGNVDAYNAGVPDYNRLVDEYNAEINSTTALINRYNALIDTRNRVAGELADLAKALDTRLTPEPSR